MAEMGKDKRNRKKEEKSVQGPRRTLAEAEVKATCVALLLTHALPSWRPGSRIKADGREQVSRGRRSSRAGVGGGSLCLNYSLQCPHLFLLKSAHSCEAASNTTLPVPSPMASLH